MLGARQFLRAQIAFLKIACDPVGQFKGFDHLLHGFLKRLGAQVIGCLLRLIFFIHRSAPPGFASLLHCLLRANSNSAPAVPHKPVVSTFRKRNDSHSVRTITRVSVPDSGAQTSPFRPRICRTLASGRGYFCTSNRSVSGSNRTSALPPKSLSQTLSCSSA